MIAVLTGDIVSSRTLDLKKIKWSKRLKQIIEKESGLRKTPRWDVFRGDGFQVELDDPSQALRLAILIRAGLRSMSPETKIDARIGIGIGEKGYTGKSVNESTGAAYLQSGALLDSLKNESHRLEISTPWPAFNKYNITLKLASLIIDGWTFAEAEAVFLRLSDHKTQQQIARKLRISQPAVHKRFINGHCRELEDVILFFEAEVIDRMQNQST